MNIKQATINRLFRIIYLKLDNQEFMLAANRYLDKVIQLCTAFRAGKLRCLTLDIRVCGTAGTGRQFYNNRAKVFPRLNYRAELRVSSSFYLENA